MTPFYVRCALRLAHGLVPSYVALYPTSLASNISPGHGAEQLAQGQTALTDVCLSIYLHGAELDPRTVELANDPSSGGTDRVDLHALLQVQETEYWTGSRVVIMVSSINSPRPIYINGRLKDQGT
ncbi:hypothetical protein BJ741DRAFT_579764 [Chytriomyces cf. hyalinus JEL632]|nr:hypothetical protein BJ741DRAFT_579764 [Chytriomyces cf. hyalinus JEL632]